MDQLLHCHAEILDILKDVGIGVMHVFQYMAALVIHATKNSI